VHPIGCIALAIGISPSISPLVLEDTSLLATVVYKEMLTKDTFSAKSENGKVICKTKVS
jgi:hypothetical protein